MNVLHALAALLTVVLYLARVAYCASRHQITKSGASCQSLLRLPSKECLFCFRGARAEPASERAACVECSLCAPPKCKRDPDIEIDDEHIGEYPCDPLS